MGYPSLLYPNETPLYPKASVVLDYLHSYADVFNLRKHIQLNTTVKATRWNGSKWQIETQSSETGKLEEVDADLLIVANGHYHVPNFPSIPGLERWRTAGKVTHSLWYRAPFDAGEVVLVVGGGPSGFAISSEMSSTCSTLIHSVPESQPTIRDNKVLVRGRTVQFLEDERTVVFEDGSMESGIDHVFLATGYLTSCPFLSNDLLVPAIPQKVPPLPTKLHNSSQHIFPLVRDIFPLQSDFPLNSIAFMGLPIGISTGPNFEAQAGAILKVFEDPTVLNIIHEKIDIVSRYQSLREVVKSDPVVTGGSEESLNKRIAHAWHRYRGEERFKYRNGLYELAENEKRISDREKRIDDASGLLKESWQRIEASGEAGAWLKGVGSGGLDDWYDLMERVIKYGEDDNVTFVDIKI